MSEPSAKPKEHEYIIPRAYVFRGQGTSWYQPFIYALGWTCGWLLMHLLYPLFSFQRTGTKTFPRTGGVLVVSNHQSYLDPMIVGITAPREIHYMARETLFLGGLKQTILENVNAFPVKRGRGDKQTIRHCVERLKAGHVVNIFAEGTRTEDGTLQPLHRSFALIVSMAQVPVVPCVIDGSFEAWPKGQKFPHWHSLRIRYGPTIPYEVLKDLSGEEMAQLLRVRMLELQEALQSPHAPRSRARFEAESAKV